MNRCQEGNKILGRIYTSGQETLLYSWGNCYTAGETAIQLGQGTLYTLLYTWVKGHCNTVGSGDIDIQLGQGKFLSSDSNISLEKYELH